MSIFTRIKDIVSSNINAALDRAEDPKKMINLSLKKMEMTIGDIKEMIEQKKDAARETEERIKEEKAAHARWEERARKAAAKGQDDMAREAIKEKRILEGRIKEDENKLSALTSVIPSLEATLRKTEEKLKELSEKAEGLKERAESARARRKADESSTYEWERKIEEMETRLNKWEEDLKSHDTTDSFENEEIEAELERLRKECGPSASDRPL